MSARAEQVARGTSLEGVAFFGDMETLPYSLDSPIWADARYWAMSVHDDAPARQSLQYTVLLELLEVQSDAPARERIRTGLAGYDWVTRTI